MLGPAYLRGREEGQHEGQVKVLRRQIEQEFGAPPEWVDQKLNQASARELEAVGDRVLQVSTLEDLFR